MAVKALQFIHAVARKLLAKPTKPSEGIISIGNRMQAEAKAGEIAETFRLSGLTPDKWDDFIKSEKDVIKFLNIIKSSKPTETIVKEGKVIPFKYKKTFKQEIDEMGKKGEVVEKHPLQDIKDRVKPGSIFDDWAKEDPSGARRVIRSLDITDEHLNFVNTGKINYKQMEKLLDQKLKGTETWKELKAIQKRKFPDPPEDLAYGGLAGMLGEPTYADGGRVPLGAGKFVFDAARRKFLQMMGGAAAGTAAAKSGLFGLLKGSKSAVVKDLTSIPIEQVGVGYMPSWFKPLVNKVIKEGDNVTKKLATKEREIVHTKKLDDFEEVTVHQNLDEGTIEVSYKTPDSMAEAGVDFKYTAPQKMVTKKGPVKTEPTFEAVESYPESHAIGPDDAEITFEGENVVGMVDHLFSDTSKLKQYATGKKLTKLEQEVAKKKIDKVTKINKDPSAQSDLLPDYDPYASGGRVPSSGGLAGMLGE